MKSAGSFRREQEVCGSCSKPLALGLKLQKMDGLVFLVAAVAVDLAADFPTGPAGAVNIYVSGACPDSLEQLIELAGTDATLIREVRDVDGRDRA